MNKTKIEWADYTINPVKGLCPVACDYCYARAMYKRFKWNPEIRYIGRTELFNQVLRIPRDKPARIFMGSTFELFGDWMEPYWMRDILEVVNTFSFFTFIFLTKQPQNLARCFPDNCWIGVSATDDVMVTKAWKWLKPIQSKVKYISVEPLLSWGMSVKDCEWTIKDAGIRWVIIGALTPYSPKTAPQIEWVQEIVEACDKACVPVFLKDNLKSLMGGDNMRQELPE